MKANTTTIEIADLPEWLTSAETAAALGAQTRFVQKLGSKGIVRTKPANRPDLAPNARLYSREDVQEYLAQREARPESTNPEAIRRREQREREKSPWAVIPSGSRGGAIATAAGKTYKSLVLVLRDERGSTRIQLSNVAAEVFGQHKLLASLAALHELALPEPDGANEPPANGSSH